MRTARREMRRMMARRCSCISSTPIRCHDVRMHSGPDWPCDDNKPCAWRLTHSARGIPAQFRKKKIGAPFRVAPPISSSPAASSALKPKASRIHPTGSPNSHFHSRGHGTPHPSAPNTRGRLGKTAKPQSHILTPPFPTTKLRPSITPTRRVDDRPTSGDCAFAPRLCLSPSSRLRLAGSDWPAQPNLGQIGVRLGFLSISSQSPHMHWRATSLLSSLEGQRGRGARTKEKKGVEETVAGSRLGGQLVLLLFLFWPVSSSYTPPICLFCCCIIVPTLSFSGSAGAAAQRDRLVAVASSGGMG